MNQFIRIKNIVMIMLCVAVIMMAAGYVVLSMQLDNLKQQKSSFAVSFINAKKISSIKGGTKEPIGELKIDKTGKVIGMNFVLYEVHDEIDYEITVKNSGTMSASIMDLLVTPDFTDNTIMKTYSPISMQVSSIGGRILEPGEETTVKLSVFYSNTESESTMKKISGKIGLLAESAEE
ncbi:MAG: hypothetical protein IJG68_03550 [Bacilli bacterium]|nr:hypothetical protein [Bacilli bacterium]